MFTHVPGFVMFRDPTKFYLYTAIGYSVLIPFVLGRINKKAIFFIFVIYWIFTIRALFMGEVRGNFRPIQLTEEYVQLKDLLVADPVPSRTLWIPQQDPFVYKSDVHPLLTANELYNNASVSAMIRIIQNPEFVRTLAASGVKYVVVPEDPGKRIFLDDYQFDLREREALVGALGKTTLMQDAGFGNLAVFENSQFTMQKEIPSYVKRQQEYAYIGLGLSVVSLILYIGFLCRMRE